MFQYNYNLFYLRYLFKNTAKKNLIMQFLLVYLLLEGGLGPFQYELIEGAPKCTEYISKVSSLYLLRFMMSSNNKHFVQYGQ